jgi:hypothetical protein
VRTRSCLFDCIKQSQGRNEIGGGIASLVQIGRQGRIGMREMDKTVLAFDKSFANVGL